MSSLNELYRVRGDSIYTKASFGANPVSWATISGQFVYAQPRVDVNYNENSSGNFYYPALDRFLHHRPRWDHWFGGDAASVREPERRTYAPSNGSASKNFG